MAPPQAATSKTLTPDQIALLVTVVQHSQPQIPSSDWDAIAEKLGIKCAKAAKERFRYLMNHLNGTGRVRKKAPAKQPSKLTSMAKINKSARDAEQADTNRMKEPGSNMAEDKGREISSKISLDNGDTDELTKSNIRVDDIDELTHSDIRVEDLDDMFTEMESKST